MTKSICLYRHHFTSKSHVLCIVIALIVIVIYPYTHRLSYHISHHAACERHDNICVFFIRYICIMWELDLLLLVYVDPGILSKSSLHPHPTLFHPEKIEVKCRIHIELGSESLTAWPIVISRMVGCYLPEKPRIFHHLYVRCNVEDITCIFHWERWGTI